MSTKPSWQTLDLPSDPGVGARLDAKAAANRRTFVLVAMGTVLLDVALAAYFILGPIDMPAAQRWLVAGFLLLSAPVSVLVLRRALLQRTG